MRKYSFLNEFKVEVVNKGNLKKAMKLGKLGISTGAALYGSAETAVYTLVSKKIGQLIREISLVDTRDEAERILLNIGYIKDNEGNKKVKISRINYVVSKAVVGPSLQIIKNETDPLWKEHVISHLKLCKKSNGIYAAAVGIGTGFALKSMLMGLHQ